MQDIRTRARQLKGHHSDIDWEIRDLDDKRKHIFVFANKNGGAYAASHQGIAEILSDYKFGGQHQVMRNERKGMPMVHDIEELELEVRRQAKFIEPGVLQSSAFNLLVRRLVQTLRSEHSIWFREVFGKS